MSIKLHWEATSDPRSSWNEDPQTKCWWRCGAINPSESTEILINSTSKSLLALVKINSSVYLPYEPAIPPLRTYWEKRTDLDKLMGCTHSGPGSDPPGDPPGKTSLRGAFPLWNTPTVRRKELLIPAPKGEPPTHVAPNQREQTKGFPRDPTCRSHTSRQTRPQKKPEQRWLLRGPDRKGQQMHPVTEMLLLLI